MMVTKGSRRARALALAAGVVLVAGGGGEGRYRGAGFFTSYSVCSDADYKADTAACGAIPAVHGVDIQKTMNEADAMTDVAAATAHVAGVANLSGADIYTPASDSAGNRPAVIQIHGGALVFGAK